MRKLTFMKCYYTPSTSIKELETNYNISFRMEAVMEKRDLLFVRVDLYSVRKKPSPKISANDPFVECLLTDLNSSLNLKNRGCFFDITILKL